MWSVSPSSKGVVGLEALTLCSCSGSAWYWCEGDEESPHPPYHTQQVKKLRRAQVIKVTERVGWQWLDFATDNTFPLLGAKSDSMTGKVLRWTSTCSMTHGVSVLFATHLHEILTFQYI